MERGRELEKRREIDERAEGEKNGTLKLKYVSSACFPKPHSFHPSRKALTPCSACRAQELPFNLASYLLDASSYPSPHPVLAVVASHRRSCSTAPFFRTS